MSSLMQELLAQSSFDKLKEGAIVPGTITEVRQNEVVVDIGGKSEGVIPANEFIFRVSRPTRGSSRMNRQLWSC